MKKLLLVCLLLTSLSFAQTQAPRPPLVTCDPGKNVPCVVLASKTSDMAGIWKQYISNPAFVPSGGMGFSRFNVDGTFVLADTADHTAAPYKNFPHGTFSFDGNRMTINVQNVLATMPECARGTSEVRVIHLGDQPVGMIFTPIEDTCKGRLSDSGQIQVYIAPAR